MVDWQLREKHATELDTILHDNGVYLPGSRRIVKWNGPKIMSDLENRGHSNLDYDLCTCRKGERRGSTSKDLVQHM